MIGVYRLFSLMSFPKGREKACEVITLRVLYALRFSH
jgi:hypothetical protein